MHVNIFNLQYIYWTIILLYCVMKMTGATVYEVNIYFYLLIKLLHGRVTGFLGILCMSRSY